MDASRVTLAADRLQAEILLPGREYTGSRYDHSCMVAQVTLDGTHTFLSREIIGDGFGLGGIGLCCAFDWESTDIHDNTKMADSFPILGAGLARRVDTAPFLFTRSYPLNPFERITEVDGASMTVRTLPALCQGIAVEQTKCVEVNGASLTMTCTLRNVGPKRVDAVEFCHNFFKLDDRNIDESYTLRLPYRIKPSLRRGTIRIGPDCLSPLEFDRETGSTAFWLEGWEGLSSHWFRLENKAAGTAVMEEDDFPLARFYFWGNKDAFCPETFRRVSLAPGESTVFTRRYTFMSGVHGDYGLKS